MALKRSMHSQKNIYAVPHGEDLLYTNGEAAQGGYRTGDGYGFAMDSVRDVDVDFDTDGDGDGVYEGKGGAARYFRFIVAFVALAAVAAMLYALVTGAGSTASPSAKSGSSGSFIASSNAGSNASSNAGNGGGLLSLFRRPSGGIADSGMGELANDGLPSLSIPYDYDEGTVFCLYRDYIVECSKTGLYLFDKTGAEALKISIDFSAPCISRAGNFLLAYDIGGRAAFVLEDRAIRWEERFTSSIISGAMNKDGYMTFVLETSAYRNSIRVMAPIGRKLFDWVVADDYVVSAEVAPDGNSMLVNRLKTDGISVRSGLEFLDMRSEPFAAMDSGEDKAFLSAKFLEDGSVATVTGTDLAIYSANLKPVSSDSYDAVMAMCEFPARRAAVAAQCDGKLTIKVYGQRGESAELYAPELPVVNMASADGLLLVNMGRRVAVVHDNGKVARAMALDSDALYGGVCGKQRFLVVTKKSADLYELR
jgi:hypothetical protein